MPLTPEQRLARAQAITANKEAIGLRNSGIDTNVPIMDVRSVYSNEPKAPGTQNKPVVPAATVNPPAAPKPTIEDVANGLSPTDIPDFTDPYQQFGDYYKSQFETPVDEATIRKQSRDRFQAQIDAINQLYNQKLAEAQTQGQGRLGSSRAIQARSGVLGSDFGTAQTANVETYNRGIEDSVRQEQNALVQQILSQADGDATTEIANRRAAMAAGADKYLEFLQGQTERKQARLGGIVQTLFDKGVDPSRLDKATLAKITGQYGTDLGTLSAMYKGLQAEKDAAEKAALDEEIARTKSLAEIDKLTTETETGRNKTEAETFLKLAEGRLKQLEVDNYGQPPKPGTKDYAEYQKLLAETDKVRKEAENVGRDGLTAGQINTTVNSIASAFDNEPIVRAYNTTQEGYQTIKTIGVNTKSPADDIAFIYAFAKIMDPNSVVREGEYNTIQRYAQTWADNFGFSAQRVFSNTNFLTPDAKQKMLAALKPKVETIENQYRNVSSEYQRQIDEAYQGRPRTITDYSGGVPPGDGESTGDPLDDALRKEGFSYGGSDPANARKTSYLSTLGPVTGIDGSPYWKYGLDVDLKKGDPVRSPVSGTVIATAENGGFGKQVKIKGDDGREYWLSHLDGYAVQKGQRVKAGSLVGKGGNTGKVIAAGGGDGSHLDITVKEDGKYIAAREVKKLLDKVLV